MSKCFVIMGSARSGTSLTAGLLYRLGVLMGWELEPDIPGVRRFDWPDPTPMNPHGFYADAPLENCQDGLWGDRYPKEGTRPFLSSPHVAEFKRLICLRCARGIDWGFKASRIQWMMPELLESCTDEIHFVVTQRELITSASSLVKWFPEYGLDRCQEWVRRVTAQTQLVLEQYPNFPRIEMPFNDYFENPSVAVQRLAEFVKRPVTQEALAFVDPTLRRAG